MADKKAEGRQKLEMAKKSNPAHLYASYSKRRNGVFKKANEMSTMCDAEVALLVPTPSQRRITTFGSPSVETVVGKFLSENTEDSKQILNADEASRVEKLTQELTLLKMVNETRSKSEKNAATNEEDNFFAKSIKDLSLQKLQEQAEAMRQIAKKLEEKTANASSSSK